MLLAPSNYDNGNASDVSSAMMVAAYTGTADDPAEPNCSSHNNNTNNNTNQQ
jgi:hypothetical protein